MATKEQLEAWAADAANSLCDKIGKGGNVVVLVMDAKDPQAPYVAEHRGPMGVAVLLYLLEVGYRTIKDILLPKTTLLREGDGR